MMAHLVSYNIDQLFEESSMTDETLLQFAKELYKKGFIKASIEYDEKTDTNRIKYSITASKLESDEWKSESTKHKQVVENPSSDIKTSRNLRNFLKSLSKNEKKLN